MYQTTLTDTQVCENESAGIEEQSSQSDTNVQKHESEKRAKVNIEYDISCKSDNNEWEYDTSDADSALESLLATKGLKKSFKTEEISDDDSMECVMQKEIASQEEKKTKLRQ